MKVKYFLGFENNLKIRCSFTIILEAESNFVVESTSCIRIRSTYAGEKGKEINDRDRQRCSVEMNFRGKRLLRVSFDLGSILRRES